eukprot:SAG11_NODE_29519_length_310_cov_0.668246_1_plen_31_part_01
MEVRGVLTEVLLAVTDEFFFSVASAVLAAQP